MFQIKHRLQFSYCADTDIASICLKDKKRNPAIAPVPIHTLHLISSVRAKLNLIRKKEIVLKSSTQKKLAIFIPYRNRLEHLKIFISKITKFFEKTKIHFRIFVIEQQDHSFFNRAALLNLGVREFGDNFDYYCFHDVDLIPLKADYACYNQPLRLVSAIADAKNKIPKQPGKGIYNHHFASVVSITKEAFLDINGFSNLYHHYGLEDDDFFFRLLLKKYIPCVNLSGYYLSLPHSASQKILPDGKVSRTFLEKRQLKNQIKKNKKLFSSVKRGLKNPFTEGLNTLEYKIISVQDNKDYVFCSAYLLASANSNSK